MKYYCNPMNLEYRYQLIRKLGAADIPFRAYREAADPSLVLFKGNYYLFPSMTAGFFVSDDLYKWKLQEFLQDMPVYDYAPDVRAVGDYLYFSASGQGKNCSFFRTRDPLLEPFEEIKGTFPFWDPNLFMDDDGRIYFYWGCSNTEPIYGVELNPETMEPLTKPLIMVDSCIEERGYERSGNDHTVSETDERTDNRPYIEGAWMTKHNGRYYLQYAVPGTECNIYCDGVCVSDSPLGPFRLAANNPYSYKPGGFITGAGHGSTLKDKDGNFWHTSSMRISSSHIFERRLGLWKAGFDEDGELYCDQRYADWPIAMEKPAFSEPDWMLLSYRKAVRSSSGKGADHIVDENIRTCWRADANCPGEWVEIDLGNIYDLHAVQVNFADEQVETILSQNEKVYHTVFEDRYLDTVKRNTRWLLEGSIDGERYFVIEDKRDVQTDYAHDFIVREEGIQVRYVKLTVEELPYNAVPAISGIRVFGLGKGEVPAKAEDVTVRMVGDLDMEVSWKMSGCVGANILWGHEENKLYHSYMVFESSCKKIGALMSGQSVYVRVDVFNENGIAEGKVIKVR